MASLARLHGVTHWALYAGTSRLFPGVKIASCRVGDEYAVLPVPPPVKPCETTQLSPEDLAMYQLTRTGGSALYPGVIFTT
eukprot:3288620-Ditylum_brightwellii.AAC.1